MPEPSRDDCTDADIGFMAQGEEQFSSMTASCQRCVATAGDDDDLAFAVSLPEPSRDDCTDADFVFIVQGEEQFSSMTASCQRCVGTAGDDAWMACIPAPSEDDCTVEDFGLIRQGDEYFTQTTARCQFCLGANDGIENGWTGCFPAGTSCTSDETTLGEGCLMGACEDEAPPDGIGSACMVCLAKATGDLDALTQAHLDSCEADETAATDDIDPAPENSVVAQLTLDIEMPAEAELDAFKGSFSADVAATLDGVSADDVVITSVTSGSVVVDFYIAPAADGTALVSADAMTTALAADVSIAGATLTADSVTSAPTVAPAPGGDEDEAKTSRASAMGASAVAVLIVAAVL